MSQILLAVGSRPDVRLFKRATGFDHLTNTRYGIVGGADLHGWLAPSGRAIEIEVKVGKDRLSEEQRAFRDTARRFGVLYVEARSVEDVTRAIP